MKNSFLYHRDLGLPDVPLPAGVFALRYGPHALRRGLNVPEFLETRAATVLEIELCGTELKKILFRLWYDKDFDIILVIDPRNWWVRSAWLNHKTDKHETLDVSRYEQVAK